MKALDWETVNTFHLNISARDHGQPPYITTISLMIHVVDVNDNAPTFEQTAYNVTVLESVPVGFAIIRLLAWDKDNQTSKLKTFLRVVIYRNTRIFPD